MADDTAEFIQQLKGQLAPFENTPDEGSCYNCGLLCKMSGSDRPGPTDYFSVEWNDRYVGRLLRHDPQGDGSTINTMAQCYVQETANSNPFLDLFGMARETGRVDDKDVVEVLAQDRQCPSWTNYQPGRDLNQHYEDWRMMQIEKLRQEQANLQLQLMADHKQITETLAEISKSQVKIQEAEGATNTRFNVLFAILAGLTLLLALTSLAYPDGVGWLVENVPGAAIPQIPLP